MFLCQAGSPPGFDHFDLYECGEVFILVGRWNDYDRAHIILIDKHYSDDTDEAEAAKKKTSETANRAAVQRRHPSSVVIRSSALHKGAAGRQDSTRGENNTGGNKRWDHRLSVSSAMEFQDRGGEGGVSTEDPRSASALPSSLNTTPPSVSPPAFSAFPSPDLPPTLLPCSPEYPSPATMDKLRRVRGEAGEQSGASRSIPRLNALLHFVRSDALPLLRAEQVAARKARVRISI